MTASKAGVTAALGACLVAGLLAEGALAQEAGADGANEVAPSAKYFSPFPVKDYTGDLWDRPNLTGDWDDRRNALAEDGITLEVWITQVLQGVMSGGKSTDSSPDCVGSVDYYINIDTGRIGLWPGGMIKLHGETIWGIGANSAVGAILPINYDALLPKPNDPGLTTLSEVFLMQALSERVFVLAGKIDLTGFADMNEFANSEKTQFLYTGLKNNPIAFPLLPYTPLAAAIGVKPTDDLSVFFVGADTNGVVTESGFDTAFHEPEGWTLGMEIDLRVNPFGRSGTQRLGFGYSTKDFLILDQDFRLLIPDVAATADRRPDDWNLYYNFDQYLYTEDADPTQGVGIFGRFGWSTGQSNPIEVFYSIGLGGKGLCPGRDADTFGIGYAYTDYSDDLPRILDINSEQAFEVFYNVEIAPWIHITPDIQVIIDPGGSDKFDTAVVYGIRTQMEF